MVYCISTRVRGTLSTPFLFNIDKYCLAIIQLCVIVCWFKSSELVRFDLFFGQCVRLSRPTLIGSFFCEAKLEFIITKLLRLEFRAISVCVSVDGVRSFLVWKNKVIWS